MQQPSPSEETTNLLARLSQRPGVQSTLILSRESGAIVRCSGLTTPEDEVDERPNTASTTNGSEEKVKSKGTRKAEDVARLVWTFVKSAGTMIEELNGATDEAKLLRIRTKRDELVIVPDSKFLLVVIHDTPPAYCRHGSTKMRSTPLNGTTTRPIDIDASINHAVEQGR